MKEHPFIQRLEITNVDAAKFFKSVLEEASS